MKQPNESAQTWSGQLAVEPDARQVLSESEITDFFVAHLKGENNVVVKLIRMGDHSQTSRII